MDEVAIKERCGCIACAAPADRIHGWLANAGFVEIRVTPQAQSRTLIGTWAPGRNIKNHVVSALVEARKPVDRQPADGRPR